MPLITVLVPVFNGESYLTTSVDSAINQTYRNIEIIILDDCSTDATSEIAQQLKLQDSRIIYHRNKNNVGVAITRNKGFLLAQGEYIALLDADDCWYSNKLQLQLAYMQKNNLDVCYASYSFFDANGTPFGRPYMIPERLTMNQLVSENVIGCSTTLFRKELTSSVQMRTDYAHEDYVFWLELMQKGYQFGGINQPLVQYRVIKNSRSGNKKIAAINRWKIYRDFLKMDILSSAYAFSFYAVKATYKYFWRIDKTWD